MLEAYSFETPAPGRTTPVSAENARATFALRPVLAIFILLCAGALSLSAQGDGNAGGNWRTSSSEDTMTAAKRVTFELVSDDAMGSNRDVPEARIEMLCENGKYKTSTFTPGGRLAPPNRPGFWGQPQMEVRVRVDSSHSNHGWNWNGKSLSMDKGTTRELLGAQIFKIQYMGPRGPVIAEFSPAGIDLGRVSRACSISPKKPGS
jgi:hypothetical protein